jgi:hypothetical protein
MASDRDGPYHRQYLGDAQSQRIDVIPTPWATTRALGLGVAQVLMQPYLRNRHSEKCKIFAFDRDRNNNAYY